jgi:rubrerythrin
MTEVTESSLEMVKTALEMEEKGKKFYQNALDKCADPLGKDIFTKLRDDEDVHIERIKEIYAALSGGQGWTEAWKSHHVDESGLKQVFRELAAQHGKKIGMTTDDVEALQVGLDFEQKSVDFYAEHAKRATDPLEKQFVERMVEEERGHHAALADIKFYIDNPEAWFEEKGRSLLDGA